MDSKTANDTRMRFFMTKKHHTETFLSAKKQGKADVDFIPFCEFVRKTNHYFTSSCCAGRIVLVGLTEEETKHESAFHRKWHRNVTFNEVREGEESYTGHVLWFKQEPFILHLGTDTLERARTILALAEKVGIKRAGIKVAKEGRFIVEMLGTQTIIAPLKEGNMQVSEEYLKYLVKKGNEKFKKNQLTLKKLARIAKKMLD